MHRRLMVLMLGLGLSGEAAAACNPAVAECPAKPLFGLDLGVELRPAVRKPVKKTPEKPVVTTVVKPPAKPAARPKQRAAIKQPDAQRAKPQAAPSWDGLENVPVITLTAEDLLPVADQFIIRFDLAALAAAGLDPAQIDASAIAVQFGIPAFQIRSIQRSHLPGFVANLTATQLALVRASPLVARVSPDTRLKRAGSIVPWNLDRLDQEKLPLDNLYRARASLGGARVYLLDSGIDRSHPELAGRIDFGAAFVPQVPLSDAEAAYCRLHGTAMASLIAGRSTGVAADTSIIDLTVLPCWEQATGTVSVLVEAFHWLLDRELAMEPRQPAVVNLSLTGPHSADLDEWIEKLIENRIAVVAAAGNENSDACNYSPASAKGAVTVAASGPDDSRPEFSNFGSCIDVRAPGVKVTAASSANHAKPYAANGTSASAAIVSGILARNMAQVSGERPRDALVSNGVNGADQADGPLVQADSSIRYDCRVASSAKQLHLREFPAKGARVVASLSAGDRVELQGVMNDWGKVTSTELVTGWAVLATRETSNLEKAGSGGPCR